MKKSRSVVAFAIPVVVVVTTYIGLYQENYSILKADLLRFTDYENKFSSLGISSYEINYNSYETNREIKNISNIKNDVLVKINTSHCTRSYPEDKSCYFRDALRKPGLPDLHSVFADPIGNYVALVGLKFSTDEWNSRTFFCDFPEGEEIQSDPVLEDSLSFGWLPQYIVIITCKLPIKYQTRQNFKINFRILPNDTSLMETKMYENITVCQTDTNRKHLLAMCTMVKGVDEFIPSWLQYYKYMGVDHVYIYDNADTGGNSTMTNSLKEFIDSGFITVIPWGHTKSPSKTYLEVQIAHENDCLWRHRHHVLWMIKTDVDEYIQPMDPQRAKIVDYLKDPKLYSLGGLRIQNWFFGRQENSVTTEGNIIERNQWRSKMPTMPNTGHDKNILRPINVHYFKIHAIKLGGELKSLNPYNELRMVHYRGDNPRYLNFRLPKMDIEDNSMAQIWKSVLSETQNTT